MFQFTTTRLLVGVATLAVLVFAYRRNRALLIMILADIAEARIDQAIGGGKGPRPRGPAPQKPSGRERRRHLRLVPAAEGSRPRSGTGWLRRHRGPGLVGPLVAATVVSTAAYVGSTAEQSALTPMLAPSVSLAPQLADETGEPRDVAQPQAHPSVQPPSPSSTRPPAKTPAPESSAGGGAEAKPAEPTPTEEARVPEPSPSVPSTTPPPEDIPAPSGKPNQCDELTLDGVLGECGLRLDGVLGGLTEEGS